MSPTECSNNKHFSILNFTIQCRKLLGYWKTTQQNGHNKCGNISPTRSAKNTSSVNKQNIYSSMLIICLRYECVNRERVRETDKWEGKIDEKYWSWRWYATPHGLVKWWGVTNINIFFYTRFYTQTRWNTTQSPSKKWIIVMSKKKNRWFGENRVQSRHYFVRKRKHISRGFSLQSIWFVCKKNMRFFAVFFLPFQLNGIKRKKVHATFLYLSIVCFCFLGWSVLDENT